MADNFNMKKFLVENKLGAYSKLKEEYNTSYDIENVKPTDILKIGGHLANHLRFPLRNVRIKDNFIILGRDIYKVKPTSDNDFEVVNAKTGEAVFSKNKLMNETEEKFYAPSYVAKKYGSKAKEIEDNIEDEKDNNPNIWDLYTSLETEKETDEFVKGFMNEGETTKKTHSITHNGKEFEFSYQEYDDAYICLEPWSKDVAELAKHLRSQGVKLAIDVAPEKTIIIKKEEFEKRFMNEGEAAYEYEKGKAAGEKEEKAKLTKEGGDEDKLPLTPKMKKFIDKVISDAKKDGEFEELVQVDYFENDLIDFILEKFDEESDYDDVSQEVKDYINRSVKDYYRNPDGTPYFSEDLNEDSDENYDIFMDGVLDVLVKDKLITKADVDALNSGRADDLMDALHDEWEGFKNYEETGQAISRSDLNLAARAVAKKIGKLKEDLGQDRTDAEAEKMMDFLAEKEKEESLKEGEDVFADIDDDIAYGTDSKEDAIEYLEDIIDYCQKKIVELENEQGYEEEDNLGEAVSQVTLPKGITLGSNNPEGDKLVLRFLQGIAKKFDYPVAKAAMFVKERLKKLGY